MLRTSAFVAATCVLTPLATVNSIVLAQQTYPAKPIRMVAPFAAGGLVDVLARAVGDKLRPTLGQPVIIDNRPGAGGNIGADLVAKAEPDGYTLLMSSAGILTINESLYQKMPFCGDGVRPCVTGGRDAYADGGGSELSREDR